MLDAHHQENIVDSWTHMTPAIAEGASHFVEAMRELRRPSTIYKPKLFIDGTAWCALYGENLQDGVAGFGESPADAYTDFDKNWGKPLRKKSP